MLDLYLYLGLSFFARADIKSNQISVYISAVLASVQLESTVSSSLMQYYNS